MMPVILLKMFSTLRGLAKNASNMAPKSSGGNIWNSEIRTQNNLHFQGTDCNLIVLCSFLYWFYDFGHTLLKLRDFLQVMYSANYQTRVKGAGTWDLDTFNPITWCFGNLRDHMTRTINNVQSVPDVQVMDNSNKGGTKSCTSCIVLVVKY